MTQHRKKTRIAACTSAYNAPYTKAESSYSSINKNTKWHETASALDARRKEKKRANPLNSSPENALHILMQVSCGWSMVCQPYVRW